MQLCACMFAFISMWWSASITAQIIGDGQLAAPRMGMSGVRCSRMTRKHCAPAIHCSGARKMLM